MRFVKIKDKVFMLTSIGQKLIGKVSGDWYITSREHKHLFVKYKGFGLSRDLIKLFLQNKIQNIRINYQGIRGVTKKITYRSNIYDFLDEIKRYTHVDVGEDTQYILPTKYMKKQEMI